MIDFELLLKLVHFLTIPGLIYLSALIIPNSFRSLSTLELIEKCIDSSNSSKAWDEFKYRFDDHIQLLLYKTCSKFYRYNSKEVDEILKDLKQDVYIKLLDNNCEGLRKFNGSSTASLKAYLGVIAHHLTINYINRHQKRFVSDGNIENEVEQNVSAGTEQLIFPDLEEKYLKDAIFSILKKHYNSRKFNRDFIIFWLFYFEKFTSSELAEKFDLSPSGIESLVTRMKKVLIENYEK